MMIAVTLRAGPGAYSTRFVNMPGAIGSGFASTAPGANAAPSNLKNAAGRGLPFCTITTSSAFKSVTGCPRRSVATIVNSTSVVPARKIGVDSCCAYIAPAALNRSAAAASVLICVTVEYRLQRCNLLVPARHTPPGAQDCAARKCHEQRLYPQTIPGIDVAP